jgi:hypothetical protein
MRLLLENASAAARRQGKLRCAGWIALHARGNEKDPWEWTRSHAGDVDHCVRVLVNEDLYRAQDLNPAYQNPDRRGWANYAPATRDDQDGERYIMYTQVVTCVPEP